MCAHSKFGVVLMAGEDLTLLATIDIPDVFADISTYTDLMDVIGETVTAGQGGGVIKSADAVIYADVPVTMATKATDAKMDANGKLLSRQEYTLYFPVYRSNGTRLTVNPISHKLSVKARGNEPVKVFRIEALSDTQGILYQAVCIKEN